MRKTVAVVIVALICLSMIGSSFALYFSHDLVPGAAASSSTDPMAAQIQAVQSQIDGLNQSLKTNPQDTNLRLSLANDYYDLGMLQANLSQSTAQAQATASLKQAVAAYQEVLKTKKDDVNILLDMATAAFFAGDNALAETTYKQALALKPDSFNGLLNYGYFLMNGKGDYLGAIAEFNKALNTNPSPEDADHVKSLISAAQAQLNAANSANSSANGTGK